MRWRRLFVLCLSLGLLMSAYVASPFVSMWSLRDAVKRADTASIQQRVDWPRVRDSLRASLARHANLLPEATAAGAEIQPTLWQRLKGTFGASMLDRFIETYVTPEGLPKLFDYRTKWRDAVASVSDDPEPVSRLDRMKRFWSRIKRAEFKSLTEVEIEVEDRRVADRRYVSLMQFNGLGWTLIGLRVVSNDPAARLANLMANPAR
jgi:Protein of unknown function (DUF2939)